MWNIPGKMNVSTLGQGWRQGRPSCSLRWRGCCDWGFAPRQCGFECSQQAQADSAPYCCQQRSSASCQDFTGLWLPPQSPGKVNFNSHFSATELCDLLRVGDRKIMVNGIERNRDCKVLCLNLYPHHVINCKKNAVQSVCFLDS